MFPQPLVVAAPRSGFSLLIAIINTIMKVSEQRPRSNHHQTILRGLVDVASYYVTRRYIETFARLGITRDLVFNGEFHLLVGGPKWLDKTKPDIACFRKYFGIRGMGDFLLVTSHPREVLEYDGVLHSHTAPAFWLEQPYYESFEKFTSVRNPIGIINSACFSLNAMASEYIQRFMPDESEEFIRQRHGLYKLTDLEFVRGLVKFLKAYLDEFLAVKDRYFIMKWEDLISSPVQTILNVGKALGIKLSDEMALTIWKPMDHVNILQYHKHNYRRGHGIVGDWKNSLVNEHMEIFREHNFDHYLQELDYLPVPVLDIRNYSPYQKLIARYIQRGEIYRNTGDSDLFGFAFNKSNIDASKFNFKSFPRRKWTHVERSTVPQDTVVEAVSDTAEEACNKINTILFEVITTDISSKDRGLRLARLMEKRCTELMNEIADPNGKALQQRVFQNLYATC
jgi:hypothetical protein